MIKGFKAYKTYLALRNHFKNESYDYIKYNGVVNVKEETFKYRKDRWKFAKVEDTYRENTFRFLLANFIADTGFYIGQAMQPKHRTVFEDWVSYCDSSSYRFNEDVGTILEYCDERNVTFLSLFQCEEMEHPRIYQMYLQDHIHFITFCILCETSGLYTRMDQVLKYDPVWSNDSMKVKKTIPFIEIKKEHKQKIIESIKSTENN